MNKRVIKISLCFFLFLALTITTFCKTNIVSKELFEEKYNTWVEWKTTPAARLVSCSRFDCGDKWLQLIDLGVYSIPYLIEKMETEHILNHAFYAITYVDTRKKPLKEHYNKEEPSFEEIDTYNAESNVLWWGNERKHLKKRIQKDIDEYNRLKRIGKEDDISDLIESIQKNYGIFSLPYLASEVKNGDTGLLSVIFVVANPIIETNEKNTLSIIARDERLSDKEKRVFILELLEKYQYKLDEIEDFLIKYCDFPE